MERWPSAPEGAPLTKLHLLNHRRSDPTVLGRYERCGRICVGQIAGEVVAIGAGLEVSMRQEEPDRLVPLVHEIIEQDEVDIVVEVPAKLEEGMISA